MENIVIVGAGPAGLSAAIYAARADLRPLVNAHVGCRHLRMWRCL